MVVRECKICMHWSRSSKVWISVIAPDCENQGFIMLPLTLTDFYEVQGSTLQSPDPQYQVFIDIYPEPNPQADEGSPARYDTLVI